MIKIRKGAFETNSSSTHAICINKTVPRVLPDEVFFGLGEFGWEEYKFCNTTQKLAYLHSAIWNKGHVDYAYYVDKITRILNAYGIFNIQWQQPKDDDWYYVDHSEELDGLLDIFIEEPDLLISYLFNSDSFVVTANDNEYDSDDNPAWNASDEYGNKEGWFVYDKGN